MKPKNTGKKGSLRSRIRGVPTTFLGNVYAAKNQPQRQIESYNNALKALDEIIRVASDPNDLLAREQIQNELEELKK